MPNNQPAGWRMLASLHWVRYVVLLLVVALFAISTPGIVAQESDAATAPVTTADTQPSNEQSADADANDGEADGSAKDKKGAIGIQEKINEIAGNIVSNYLEPVLFYGVPMPVKEPPKMGADPETVRVPLVLLVLVVGGIFFTPSLEVYQHSVVRTLHRGCAR